MVKQINELIQQAKTEQFDANQISDGYHTFGELYEFRNVMFVRLLQQNKYNAFRAIYDSDGSKWDGWFVACLFKEQGKQISFHLPHKYWEVLRKIETYERFPNFDGHDSAEALRRLNKLIGLK